MAKENINNLLKLIANLLIWMLIFLSLTYFFNGCYIKKIDKVPKKEDTCKVYQYIKVIDTVEVKVTKSNKKTLPNKDDKIVKIKLINLKTGEVTNHTIYKSKIVLIDTLKYKVIIQNGRATEKKIN